MIYKKLRGAIREKFGTQEAFAKAIDMHPTTLSFKLSGKSDWTKQDIAIVCEKLDIPIANVPEYFFAA